MHFRALLHEQAVMTGRIAVASRTTVRHNIKIMVIHWDILDSSRKKLLPQLAFAKSHQFYLAGGTALALQLGHRTSIDFDFYSKEKFDEMAFERDAVENLKGLKVTQRSWQTLIGQVGRIDVSYFYYPYPLLDPLIETESINLSSVSDIAAMKLIAISQRGIRRDFLDLYVISMQSGLEMVFEWGKRKFSQFDPYVCLQALTYFEDAEHDTSGRGMSLTDPVPWSEVKKYFRQEASRLAKIWL